MRAKTITDLKLERILFFTIFKEEVNGVWLWYDHIPHDSCIKLPISFNKKLVRYSPFYMPQISVRHKIETILYGLDK
ncbi:hypothetical protein [Maribacter sp. 2304DJ31-5]|uniref:hypothetical protein n=1 Tax=Maribacter sp. 2304DJ31-5 TaxID=3386273 RepID=UPI0039BCAAFE